MSVWYVLLGMYRPCARSVSGPGHLIDSSTQQCQWQRQQHHPAYTARRDANETSRGESPADPAGGTGDIAALDFATLAMRL
jgi:hypothetical protein